MTEEEVLNNKNLILDGEQDNLLVMKEILLREGFKNLDCEPNPK